MSNVNHSVTPTYHSLLILGLDTVANRLMDGDELGGWQALKTLYAELPPDCQKECNEQLSIHEKQLGQIRSLQGFSIGETAIKRASATKHYLSSANLELFDKFKNSLFSKGYLENAPTKPRNLRPITLGEST
jgi:hypothetical protein